MALAAVIYLLWDERAHRRSEAHNMRQVDEESLKHTSAYQPTTRWYTRLFFGMGSNAHKDGVRDRGAAASRREQGWIRAETVDEWESDSVEDAKPRTALRGPKEYDPSLTTTTTTTDRTSAAYPLPRRSLVRSFVSNRSSSPSVLPSDLPVLAYSDDDRAHAPAPSVRYSIPSVYSQLLPPPSPTSAASHHSAQRAPSWTISTVSVTPVRISTSHRVPSSPISIEHAPSDSHEGSELAETMSQKPSLRTFEGGTKFIEAL